MRPTRDTVLPNQSQFKVVVIGASTGGPSALERVLAGLPRDFPVPVLISQHIPKLFTGGLARRLDLCCALPVLEAYDGAVLRNGGVWIAPGDAHMSIESGSSTAGGANEVVRLSPAEERCFQMPSADVLFRSAAKAYASGTLAVVMTGMGADGLAGARAVHQAGGTVFAQDRTTSAVWGMPRRVFDAGIARRLLPLDDIAGEIIAAVALRKARPTLPAWDGRDPVGTGTTYPAAATSIRENS